jgi:ribose/xylose/arabinose/galactoside ABC-type transport system permease subunit
VGRDRPDLTSLVAGIAILALGALLLLHATGGIELSFGVLAPAACAAAGAILVASGMSRRR